MADQLEWQTDPKLLVGTDDPSAGAGVRASEASLYLRSQSGVIQLWQKTLVPDTGWTILVASPATVAAMFYGTTTGTGSEGNDYAATVAVGAAVPFPRNGPTNSGRIARSGSSTTEFVVSVSGLYEVSWEVGFVEASQLQVAVNGTPVANTTSISGAGTQMNANTALLTLVAADVISIINPTGNAAALTVQPADGSLTHAQAPSLVIRSV